MKIYVTGTGYVVLSNSIIAAQGNKVYAVGDVSITYTDTSTLEKRLRI